MNATSNSLPELDSDLHAVIDNAALNQALDPEVKRRIQERAETIRKEILEKHGVQEIGVQYIRELRGELPDA